MAEHRPKLLKTHRARIENMLYVLPKQVWPTALLYYHVMARTAEGIRENVLLCKAWGVTKSDTLDVIGNALVYGQISRAHVCTPVTNATHVCRLLLYKKQHRK